ncbi:hypothetical protein BX666DRAFT_2000122 [Dichotomocladium elegans]|nr:hypothetical protein BX666DRAFT_2000122 [Dichotomocladium elegans]
MSLPGISKATNLSNWTLALALGATAALKSGAQQGLEGELPFCDLFMVLTSLNENWRNEDPSRENVFIGFNSFWTRMMLKSFEARRLKFVALILEDTKDTLTCDEKNCHMIRDPVEVAAKKHEGTSQQNKNIPDMTYGLVEKRVKERGEGNNRTTETFYIIHTSECIRKRKVDEQTISFKQPLLKEMLRRSPTNEDAMNNCKRLINIMGDMVYACPEANEWDTKIIDRVRALMNFPDVDKINTPVIEAMDRIHSRFPEMFELLNLKSFTMDDVHYTTKDVIDACTVYFGIVRALYMSDVIYGVQRSPSKSTSRSNPTDTLCKSKKAYEKCNFQDVDASSTLVEDKVQQTDSGKPTSKGLVFMGNNVDVGHELIKDIVEVPSLNDQGYSSAQLIEGTKKERINIKEVDLNIIFITSIMLDAALAVAIMLLSSIGPILSMYTAHMVTAPYRESYLKMGTSMRWSVGQATMLHSGTARDDWMVAINPIEKMRTSILIFTLVAFTSCALPIIFWFVPLSVWKSFRYDDEGNNNLQPNTEFGIMIAALGLVVGSLWVFLSLLNRDKNFGRKQVPSTNQESQSELGNATGGNQNATAGSDNAKEKQGPSRSTVPKLWAHIISCIFLTSIPLILAMRGVEEHWVYLYLLEFLYFFQWLYGELKREWEHESISLFMIGIVSAIRLNTIE